MRGIIVAGLILIAVPAAHADERYPKILQSFLKENCIRCHGPKKSKGDLRLDTLASWTEAERSEGRRKKEKQEREGHRGRAGESEREREEKGLRTGERSRSHSPQASD